MVKEDRGGEKGEGGDSQKVIKRLQYNREKSIGSNGVRSNGEDITNNQ